MRTEKVPTKNKVLQSSRCPDRPPRIPEEDNKARDDTVQRVGAERSGRARQPARAREKRRREERTTNGTAPATWENKIRRRKGNNKRTSREKPGRVLVVIVVVRAQEDNQRGRTILAFSKMCVLVTAVLGNQSAVHSKRPRMHTYRALCVVVKKKDWHRVSGLQCGTWTTVTTQRRQESGGYGRAGHRLFLDTDMGAVVCMHGSFSSTLPPFLLLRVLCSVASSASRLCCEHKNQPTHRHRQGDQRGVFFSSSSPFSCLCCPPAAHSLFLSPRGSACARRGQQGPEAWTDRGSCNRRRHAGMHAYTRSRHALSLVHSAGSCSPSRSAEMTI